MATDDAVKAPKTPVTEDDPVTGDDLAMDGAPVAEDGTAAEPVGPDPAATMALARAAMSSNEPIPDDLPIKVGVDLGTAFSVIMITDEHDRPLAGATVFADVVRDGIVWDFSGAQTVIARLRDELERRTGRLVTSGTVTVPPAVNNADHRAHRFVLEGAGIACTEVVDEPTAANAVLGLRHGAVVDIGGGTTGVAIISDGEVVATYDEPSGGTHLSLVISGALGIPLEEAEVMKRDPKNHERLFGLVLPVMQKMSTIVARMIEPHHVEQIHLVGGTSAFRGLPDVMSGITGLPCELAPEPMLVTPLGVARWANPHTQPRKYS
ncbi:ethanolamine utilization protein EutJ [Propionibacteriaceae bacterium Y1923]|uniref:ethanolamine utilization protein EutJ n=1 Tax=Aestuariimicrobium sp. Y1814 TaxID=3418742 RepID=UPI003C2A386D